MRIIGELKNCGFVTQGNGVCYDKARFDALVKNLATNVDAAKAELFGIPDWLKDKRGRKFDKYRKELELGQRSRLIYHSVMQENDISDIPLYSTLLAIFREPGTNHISVAIIVCDNHLLPPRRKIQKRLN